MTLVRLLLAGVVVSVVGCVASFGYAFSSVTKQNVSAAGFAGGLAALFLIAFIMLSIGTAGVGLYAALSEARTEKETERKK